MEFAQALADHLAAVEARDLDRYLATVHHDATLVLANGSLLTGKESIAQFHKGWFGDLDWSLRTETLRAEATGESAFALLKVEYHDLDPEGRPYERVYYLSLFFVLTEGQWLLAHDQNTFI